MDEVKILFGRLVSQMEASGRPRDAELLRILADSYLIESEKQQDGVALARAAIESLKEQIKLVMQG